MSTLTNHALKYTVFDNIPFQVKLFNISVKNPTKVNGVPIEGECLLQHGDVFTIIDRSFRYESTIEAQIAEAVRGF